MRRKNTPKPATQEQLDAVQDEYRAFRCDIAEQYAEARRTGDHARAARLWDYWKYLRMEERDTMLAALQGLVCST